MSQRYTSKSVLIKCTICGKLFHSRGLHMHMKLAHDKGSITGNNMQITTKKRLLAENSNGITRMHKHASITDSEREQLFVLLGAMAGYLGYRLLKKR